MRITPQTVIDEYGEAAGFNCALKVICARKAAEAAAAELPAPEPTVKWVCDPRTDGLSVRDFLPLCVDCRAALDRLEIPYEDLPQWGTARRYRRRPNPNAGTIFDPDTPRREEVIRLMDQCGTTWVGQRNRVLIILMWRAGLRVSEAVRVRPKDVDLDSGTIFVRYPKGGDRYTASVGIDQDAEPPLRSWFDLRQRYATETAPFACTRKGNPVPPSYVRRLLPRLAARAGIERRVHPHGLRAAMAVELVREGVHPAVIQRQLRHRNLATTDTYLRSLVPADVIDVMRRREWQPTETETETETPQLEQIISYLQQLLQQQGD